jgi:predicted DNA-binding transcriptional regulator YafY
VLERVRNRVEFKESERKFFFVAQGGESALPDGEGELDEVVDALLNNQILRVDYLDFAGQPSQRTVEPLTLAIYQHQLYLIARENSKLTVLRFSRMRNASATRKTFRYPARAEYDPATVFRSVLGIFIKEDPAIPIADVVLRMKPSWKNYATYHRWHESQQNRFLEDGIEIRLHVGMCAELEQLILSFGDHCEVVEPVQLRQRIQKRVRAMATALDQTNDHTTQGG